MVIHDHPPDPGGPARGAVRCGRYASGAGYTVALLRQASALTVIVFVIIVKWFSVVTCVCGTIQRNSGLGFNRLMLTCTPSFSYSSLKSAMCKDNYVDRRTSIIIQGALISSAPCRTSSTPSDTAPARPRPSPQRAHADRPVPFPFCYRTSSPPRGPLSWHAPWRSCPICIRVSQWWNFKSVNNGIPHLQRPRFRASLPSQAHLYLRNVPEIQLWSDRALCTSVHACSLPPRRPAPRPSL